MALKLVCGADFWCNRHCRTSPVVLEGFWGQVWPKISQKPRKTKISFGPVELGFAGGRQPSVGGTGQRIRCKQGCLRSCGPTRLVFFGFGGPKPYRFRWFGDIHGPKPYRRLGGLFSLPNREIGFVSFVRACVRARKGEAAVCVKPRRVSTTIRNFQSAR